MARSFIVAALVGLVAAQTSSTQSSSSPSTTTLSRSTITSSSASTMSVFTYPGAFLNSNYKASVITGDACRTTYALQCAASNCGDDDIPVPSGFVVTVTEGPFFQSFAGSTTTNGVAISIGQSCGISGKTSATCVYGVTVSAQRAVSTSLTTRVPAGYGSLTVTAGSIPTGSCTSTGNAALPTAFVDVYKVAVVPAAALAAAVLI